MIFCGVLCLPRPGCATQVDGDYHYDSRKQVLLWSIDLIDNTNRSGSMEFVITSAATSDAFFPVDVSFSAQHTLADVSISQVSFPLLLAPHARQGFCFPCHPCELRVF